MHSKGHAISVSRYTSAVNRSERIAAFQEAIWEWFAVHKRTLPWRDLVIKDDDERAYRILVSEVMLQQTQVPRVIIIYKRFLEEFPTLASLADASNKDVIVAWRGMGYNSRALRLRDAAKTIVETHRGHFPIEMDALLQIKGIGPYTAAAIRNFAFNIPTPCIDTNIRRILHWVFVGPEKADGGWTVNDRDLLEIARDVLDKALVKGDRRDQGDRRIARDARNWHAALMDFGSLVCTKRSPKWESSPRIAALLSKETLKKAGRQSTSISQKKEPGRFVGSRFIPNRIFRGRVIEELRDQPKGLTLEQIGSRISVDWSEVEHREWLLGLMEKLKRDALVKNSRKKYVLHT